MTRKNSSKFVCKNVIENQRSDAPQIINRSENTKSKMMSTKFKIIICM